MTKLDNVRPRDMTDEQIKSEKKRVKGLLDEANEKDKRADAVKLSDRFNDLEAERWVRRRRLTDSERYKSAVATSAENATFIMFRKTGKFYASERGHMPDTFDMSFSNAEWRADILRANQNHMPGLSTTGYAFRVIVVLDDAVPYGFPLCLEPQEDDA